MADNNLLVALGKRIRILRTRQGLSQSQLADSAGVSQTYLSEVEAGKRNVSVPYLEAIAQRLSIPVHELLKVEMEDSREAVLRELNGYLEKLPMDDLQYFLRMMRNLHGPENLTDDDDASPAPSAG